MAHSQYPPKFRKAIKLLPNTVQSVVWQLTSEFKCKGITRDTAIDGGEVALVPGAKIWMVIPRSGFVRQINNIGHPITVFAGNWIVWAMDDTSVRVIQVITREQARLLAIAQAQAELADGITQRRRDEKDAKWRRRDWEEAV